MTSISEMKKIADARTKGYWSAIAFKEYFKECWPKQNQNPFAYDEDAEFIAMASNNFDALMAVVEAAKDFSDMPTDPYHHVFLNPDVLEKLNKALKALEE